MIAINIVCFTLKYFWKYESLLVFNPLDIDQFVYYCLLLYYNSTQ